MKQFSVTAIIVCVSAAASAQTPPPLTVVPPTVRAKTWVDNVLPEGASMPYAIGVHNCLSQYPRDTKAQGIEGTTSLSYRIAGDGSVKKVKIRKSSGNAVLDKAAVACVKAWTYTPAKLDDKPIEIAWRNDVKWVLSLAERAKIVTSPKKDSTEPDIVIQMEAAPANIITTHSRITSPPPISSPASIGAPHTCTQDYPRDAIVEHAEGTTTLKFIIGVDGRTHDLGVAESSGYAPLDDAAVSCASHWLYKPALQDGKPTEIPWGAMVKWALT